MVDDRHALVVLKWSKQAIQLLLVMLVGYC